MNHLLLSVLASLSLTSQPTTSLPAGKIIAEVRFQDGSLVKMTMRQPALEVKTKYGKLTIPFADIRRITFGRHVLAETQKKISEAIGQMNNPAHRDREDAMRALIEVGHPAYPFLKKLAKHGNLEVTTRVNQLLKTLADTHLPEELNRREEDVIQTTEFTVVGRIESASIKAHSVNFGELTLKLPDLRAIHLRTGGGLTEFVVDAAKYGSVLDQWLDTDLTVDPATRLIIKSAGQIDLWPQGPGQYMTGPKGYTTAGKGGSFMAGTLLGRIGTAGKAFVIGEQFDGLPSNEGRLYLHIVPSPWNNNSAGNYQVRISTDFASTAR